MNRLPIHVLFIDLEAQYKTTIKHAEEMLVGREDEIRAYWICLPLNLRNAVSVYQPFWRCWDPKEQAKWVRPMPRHSCVVSDPGFFAGDVFHDGMEFERFVLRFAEWFCRSPRTGPPDSPTACGVGIRTQESLNRFRTIASLRKQRFEGLGWTTRIKEDLPVYNAYPIYDWRTEDVWTAVGKNGWPYNRIYDLMYMAGVSIHQSRICQPYGDDQRRGLDLFHKCEPETWPKVVHRVTGANFGKGYVRSALLGYRKMRKPPGHTWKSYAQFLLSTLPRYEAEWYKKKFERFFWWWEHHYGVKVGDVPDEADPKQEAARKAPSWRRIARAVITNDKLCRSLSFAQSPRQWEKYEEMKALYGE